MRRAAIAGLLAALLSGCEPGPEGPGAGGPPPANAPAANAPAANNEPAPPGGAPAETYQGGPVADGGRIAGRVTVAGTLPTPRKIRIDRDPKCCGEPHEVDSEELAVSTDRGLRWAVVRLDKVARGKPLDTLGPAVLDNRGCMFVPHVLLAAENAEVEFRNSDPGPHTADAYPSRNTSLGIQIPAHSSWKKAFEFAETMRVECQIHKWMSAFLWVCEHPYYAVTREDGTFELTDVPPGTYTVKAWAEFGRFEQEELSREVTVETGREARADFEFKIK